MPNLCRDCINYLKPKAQNQKPICTRTAINPPIDLVTGEPRWPHGMLECDEERYGNGGCGTAGKYWTQALTGKDRSRNVVA